MIGISITSRNRPEVFNFTLQQIKAHYNDEMKTIVINDSAHDVFDKYRKIVKQVNLPRLEYIENEDRLGIPHSKNIAFQKLKDCDYQFWFDDDCYPITGNWQNPFIQGCESDNCHHYLYLRKWSHIKFIEHFGKYSEIYTHGTACFMFFSSDCYEDMEGFNEGYGFYGYWHGDLSYLVYKKGHCPAEYTTLRGCNKYIRCMDIDGTPKGLKGFSSSMSKTERSKQLKDNRHVHRQRILRI